MKYVLTIVADKSHNTVSEEHVEVIKKQLNCVENVAWLAPGEAFDIFLEHDPQTGAESLADKLEALLPSHRLDYCLQPVANRRKKLLIADMDSTIIQQECIDEIGNILGLREKIAAITERAMRGELEFESALIERVGLLKGINRAQLQNVLETAIELTPGAKSLVRTMNAAGAMTALVSGGFTFFTDQIANQVGFQYNQANELLFEGDHLSGEVKKPILGKDAKKQALITLRDENGLDRDDTLAIGDGANDLAMIEEAGLGVAFHAKPAVAAAADVGVNKTDLTAVLYFQGYAREDFMA